jgi:hypothetical protein
MATGADMAELALLRVPFWKNIYPIVEQLV